MNSTIDQQVDLREVRYKIGSAVLWAAMDTAVLFGLVVWLYVAAVAVFYPNKLSGAIVSWIPIRQDTLGMVGFGLSAVAYFIRGIRKPSIGGDDA